MKGGGGGDGEYGTGHEQTNKGGMRETFRNLLHCSDSLLSQ